MRKRLSSSRRRRDFSGASGHHACYKIVKVDVDNSPNLSNRFGIRNIPTLLFFKGGEVKDQVVGLTSRADLISRLKTLKRTREWEVVLKQILKTEMGCSNCRLVSRYTRIPIHRELSRDVLGDDHRISFRLWPFAR